jgi:hypothetical protein
MRSIAVGLIAAAFSTVAAGQVADKQEGQQDQPKLEVVRLEVSVKPVSRTLEEPMMPKTDPDSLKQQQVDAGLPEPPGYNRPRTEISTPPRYDRNREVNTSTSPAYHPGTKSPGQYTYIASVFVRNTGDRTVESVVWEYIVVEPEGEKVVRRDKFRTKKKIAPGEIADLVQEVKPAQGLKKAVIHRIDYTDGSRWIRPSPPNPATPNKTN